VGTASVTTDFAGGNAITCDVAEDPGRVRADFAADPRNCPEAMWFHFRVQGLAGRELSLRLMNAEQTLGGEDWSNNHPVYRGDGAEWQRCGSPSEEATPSGRRLFTFTVPAGYDAVEFAHCYPYQLEDLKETLAETGDVWKGEVLGYSHHGRPISRYALEFGGEGEQRPGFYLMARQHAGETPGSWVLEGLLRYLAANESARASALWWVVPFVNIDDVVEGSYGKDPFPCDCNRAWFRLPLRTETKVIQADIHRWTKRCRPRVLIDLHAPGHQERQTYVHLPRKGRPDREYNLVFEFARRFHEALPTELRGNKWWERPTYPSRYTVGTTVSSWLYDAYALPGAGLETSYQGIPERDYTIADYHRIGQALATVLIEVAREATL